MRREETPNSTAISFIGRQGMAAMETYIDPFVWVLNFVTQEPPVRYQPLRQRIQRHVYESRRRFRKILVLIPHSRKHCEETKGRASNRR